MAGNIKSKSPVIYGGWHLFLKTKACAQQQVVCNIMADAIMAAPLLPTDTLATAPDGKLGKFPHVLVGIASNSFQHVRGSCSRLCSPSRHFNSIAGRALISSSSH